MVLATQGIVLVVALKPGNEAGTVRLLNTPDQGLFSTQDAIMDLIRLNDDLFLVYFLILRF